MDAVIYLLVSLGCGGVSGGVSAWLTLRWLRSCELRRFERDLHAVMTEPILR